MLRAILINVNLIKVGVVNVNFFIGAALGACFVTLSILSCYVHSFPLSSPNLYPHLSQYSLVFIVRPLPDPGILCPHPIKQ